MAGSSNLFDRVDLTDLSESASRNGDRVDTLQVHHGTVFNYRSLRVLMDPGGRTVSANGGLDTDGTLYEIVRLDRRAFTSATGFDRRCLTVETVNISGAPKWGIDTRSRERLARLAVAMYRAGMLGGFHRGPGGIIGHSEVPGTYATACPGPDMHLDWIADRARTLNSALAAGTLQPIEEEDDVALTEKQEDALEDLAEFLKWLKDGDARTGFSVSKRETLFDSAARLRGFTNLPGGKLNPDHERGDMLQLIREAIRDQGTPKLSDVQAAELSRAVASNLSDLLTTNQASIREELKKLPKAVITQLKNSLP